MKSSILYFLIPVLALILLACGGEEATDEQTVTEEQMYFETLSPEKTGIDFTNKLSETDSFNYMTFQYIYNGGGVAVGDINNDGLADIYFTGNQVADKLYLNKGDMVFEDITKSALGKAANDGWHTGVTMADVNEDGNLDIFVSRSGMDNEGEALRNFLLINQGDNTFKEEGLKWGLSTQRGTNQSALFDMDNDGDLDLYCMNKPYPEAETHIPVDLDTFPYSDQLFENVGGKFVDVSKKAGIQNEGYGLGIAVSDLNKDGYVDIYISNDYITPDFMYINQGNGTFVDELNDRTNHCSMYAMGNDVADFNNDGLVDIIVADMVSEDHIRSKKNMGPMSPDEFWGQVKRGNQMEYMFNTLQMNNGNGTFSDIGQLAGISKTDWSWATLFADFDNDGMKDLFITNGYRRDVRDNDFVKEYNKEKSLADEIREIHDLLDKAPATKIKNYIFKNDGDLHFSKKMKEWQVNDPVNSNGAAYADLDNDGDLDLIINNMDEVSVIMENKLQSKNNFIRLSCDKKFIGAKVTVKTGGKEYFQEMIPTRGFQSSVEPVLHFGVGSSEKIDELIVEFLDGKVIQKSGLNTNETIALNYSEAKKKSVNRPAPEELFASVDVVDHTHQEFIVDDFEREVLLPHKMSQLGPSISKGDVNGDGLEDFYVSGAIFYTGSLYLQTSSGSFEEKSGPWKSQSQREEVGSTFFDADSDGDLDLYVVSGSNEYKMDNESIMDQLYINDGAGNFTNETNSRLPPMGMSGQHVMTADYDNDGDQDIFIGGRQVPGFYPFAPRSFLLENNQGKFTDITKKSPDLLGPGMITDAIWDDFDRDNDLDIVCVGEWMPVTFFENTNGTFKNVTDRYEFKKEVGWWMSIEKGDFNGDGVNDYVVGNIGRNNKFHPSHEKPLEIYTHDFDKNGTYDIVLGKYQDGKCYPVRGRSCSSEQMPFIKEKFPTFDEFAVADLEGIYGKRSLDSALHYSATNFNSSVLLSNGSNYQMKKLPVYAQFGPINAQLLVDVNSDGNLDIVAAGNNFGVEVETIRYDGGRGVVLLGDGNGNFNQLAPHESGFFVNTDAKQMILINDLIIIASNSAKLKSFKLLNAAKAS